MISLVPSQIRLKQSTESSCLYTCLDNVKVTWTYSRENTKARYTLATKLNSTRSTLLKVDCCVAETGNKSTTKSTVADTVDFVARVYGTKATRSTLSTFNKVDRVEFNFVATVYQAIQSTLFNLLPVLATNRQLLKFDSLSRSTLLPIRSTLSPVCTGLKALRHGSHNFTCKQHHICLYLVSVHQMAPPLLWSQTSNCGLLLIYRSRKDERLSWPGWLTFSRRFTHICLAVGRAQDRESSPVKDMQRSRPAAFLPLGHATNKTCRS